MRNGACQPRDWYARTASSEERTSASFPTTRAHLLRRFRLTSRSSRLAPSDRREHLSILVVPPRKQCVLSPVVAKDMLLVTRPCLLASSKLGMVEVVPDLFQSQAHPALNRPEGQPEKLGYLHVRVP